MLERFSARARRAIVLATDEARRRRHASIGVEHLLIGILRDGDGMAVKVLERLQARPELLRADVDGLLSTAPASSCPSEPTFSPELKAVFQAALDTRRQPRHVFDHPVIGTENLLLGLLTRSDSDANRMLRAAGVEFDAARRLISLLYDRVAVPMSAVPITAENLRQIASSTWDAQM